MFETSYRSNPFTVAESAADERATFIRRTYGHLAGAILAFIALEAALFQIPGIEEKVFGLLQGQYSWLIVLAAFMAVSWIANKWAMSDTSKGMQYLGLGLYVVAEAVIFLPLLLIANSYAPQVIPQAAIVTLLLFGGLTATVFITRKDFSFLRSVITIGFFIALGIIICAVIFGFELGLLFSGAMCLLAAAAILYTTSNILHHYHTEQYVAASLALFAAVALLFWYILRIFLSRE